VYNIYTIYAKEKKKTAKRESSGASKKTHLESGGPRYDSVPLNFQGISFVGSVRPDDATQGLIPVPYPRSTGAELDLTMLSRVLHISRGVETDNK